MNGKKSIKINAIANMIKTLLSVIFPLITFPYVSRILGIETYGKYQFCSSIVNYFIYLAALGIPTYAIRNGSAIREDKEKINTFCSEMFSINVLTTLLSYILLGIYIYVCSNNAENRYIFLILSSTIIFNTIGKEWIFSIFENYLFMSIRYIFFQVISIILMFVFVKKPEDIFFYLLIVQLATGGANIVNYFYAKKYAKIKLKFKLDIKAHLLPILILFLNNISVIIYTNSDITLLGILKNEYEVGLYSVSAKIYTILKQLINGFIVVTIPRLSYYIQNEKKEEFEILASKIISVILIFIFPIMIGIYFLSADIIVLISGSEYANAYLSLEILSFALIFSAVASFYISSILIPNKKEKKVLICTIMSAIINIVLNLLLIPKYGQCAAAVTTVIAELIVMVISIYYSKNIFRYKIKIKDMLTTILATFIVILVIKMFKILINNMHVYLISTVFVSAIVYLMLHYILKTKIVVDNVNEILGELNKRLMNWRKDGKSKKK